MSDEEVIAWAAREAYVDWGVRSDRDKWVHYAITRAARLAAERIEARVRAEVAEEIAAKIEAAKPSVHSFWGAADAARVYALNDAAKIARAAAGSSRDTTPEARS